MNNAPESSFNKKTFLAGLGILLLGIILAYWQYQRWFDPEIIGGVAVRKFSLGGILFCGALIILGIASIINAFKKNTEARLIFLPKEMFEGLKKAITSKEIEDFEKLLEGSDVSSSEKEYAALTIEDLKDQPGMATIQAFMRVDQPSGGTYESKNFTESIQVNGSILNILKKIEDKYGSQILLKSEAS